MHRKLAARGYEKRLLARKYFFINHRVVSQLFITFIRVGKGGGFIKDTSFDTKNASWTRE